MTEYCGASQETESHFGLPEAVQMSERPGSGGNFEPLILDVPFDRFLVANQTRLTKIELYLL
jgi:hypothetical protein